MADYDYSTKLGENSARALGFALPISRKQSLMICNMLRGKPVQSAKKTLENVIAMKIPVPMTRFNWDRGHKAGMAAGRYPIKACDQFLKLIKSAESNAQFKGLGTAELIISHIVAQKAPKVWRGQRTGRHEAKRTTVEVVVSEIKEAKKEKKSVKK